MRICGSEKNPIQIFHECDASRKKVLITDHAYAPEHDQSATSGQYCLQFMTFTRNGGEVVRKWWEERCIEWCYARFEDENLATKNIWMAGRQDLQTLCMY